MNTHSKLYLMVCLALGGCLDGIDGEKDPAQDLASDPGAPPDEPATGTAEQDLQNSHFYQMSFGGNIFSQTFPPYLTQANDPMGDCTPGFVRPVRPSVLWSSSSGGFCQFYNWNTGDAHDCRALILAGTGGGWFGGTCTTNIQEVAEMHGTSGVFTYTASNTNSATAGTTNYGIALNAGQTLTVTVCGEQGSSFSGDTYLRLYDVWGNQASADDDTCGRGSRIVYTSTSGGSLQINAGCWSSGTCNAKVAWFIQ